MPNIPNEYRKLFLHNQALYEKRIIRLVNKVAKQIAILSNDPQSRFVKSFDFSSQTKLASKIDAIMLEFQNGYSEMMTDAVTEMWSLSNEKNDKVVDQFIRGIALIEGIDSKLSSLNKKYYAHNTKALQEFLSSEKSFSDRIWKVTNQLQREMEIHLGYGILNGDSADTISRRIRYYLKDPEMLFRRVRDEKGNLVLSKNAKEFNPGTGTYRSSYKNAVRLTRTTTNMSYLAADYERWQQLDFVIGIRVSLSASHRIIDICDELQGIYPKWFKFIGWHAQCLCIATPILMSQNDFRRQLQGETIELHYVQNVPSGFNSWILNNTDRVNGWKNTPYFIRDNFKYGKISNGLKH